MTAIFKGIMHGGVFLKLSVEAERLRQREVALHVDVLSATLAAHPAYAVYRGLPSQVDFWPSLSLIRSNRWGRSCSRKRSTRKVDALKSVIPFAL